MSSLKSDKTIAEDSIDLVMPHGFPEVGENEQLSADEQVIYSDQREEEPDLRFLHYNDIYHLEPQSSEPAGGAGRFQTICNYYRDDPKFEDQVKLITVFSGDAYNPSNESAVTRGSHMVPLLNNIGTDIACPGNHDFDFGAAQFEKLKPDCKFPWVLTNVFDPSEGGEDESIPLGHCERTHLWEASNGIKIGFMGLAEREWAEKGNSLPLNLDYHEMLDTAKKVGPELREQGADIIIAMTHCREPRDLAFGEALPEGCIDIILAGHDHWYDQRFFKNGTMLVRSGSDFKMLSYIKAWKSNDGKRKWHFEVVRRDVMRSIPEHEPTREMAEKCMEDVRKKMERPVGYTIVALDARKSTMHRKESNYGNFACDLMRLYHGSDIAVLTGRTIKGDQVHTPGIVRLKFIVDSFPFEDAVSVIRVTGKAVREALENGVRGYEDKDGLMLQVSGIKYSFDPSQKAGNRVTSIHIGEHELDMEKKYTVACRSSLTFGADGFDSLKIDVAGGTAEEVVPDEYGILLSMIVRQYFMSLKVMSHLSGQSLGKGIGGVWADVHANMAEIESVHDPATDDPKWHDPATKGNIDTYDSDDADAPIPGTTGSVEHGRTLAIMRKTLRMWRKNTGIEGDASLPSHEEEIHNANWKKGICPRLERRIQVVGVDA